ncbi:MAG: bifunctional demethylmenaquinone methyltransferase/2-methoxy-6-polyprenyl-1,4-benzoquinol methylase UbiE [Bacteriovoracaceae bacterium]|nr:bifunctional demethylmenaquinone methyltransferase/2-methoxy-6-polyprenyl-1,4-benzoquinol methylase UbiE [Bacteriovoracaceae bacterium]
MNSKADRVQGIFSQIAPKYDLVNDVMTFRMAHSWRAKTVKLSGAKPGMKILDVATGTGDFAIEFKKVVGLGEVIGVDFCAEMLVPAPSKAKALGFDIAFKQGDAMALEFEESCFDVVSIGYGLRNVSDTGKAIKEMSRVLVPGGKLMILETGRSEWPLFSAATEFYTSKVMPVLGGMLSGSKDAYKYLDSSSKEFPYGEKLVELLKREGGFKSVVAHPLFGGVSYIYECQK